MSIRYEQKVAGSMKSNYNFIRGTYKDLALSEIALGREGLDVDRASIEAIGAIGRKTELEALKTNERIKVQYIDLLKYKSEERRKQALTDMLIKVGFAGLGALTGGVPSLFSGTTTGYSAGSASATFKGVSSGLGV